MERVDGFGLCQRTHTADVGLRTDTFSERIDDLSNGDHPTPPNKGINMNNESTPTDTDDEAADTEGHRFHGIIEPAVTEDDAEGHGSKFPAPAEDDAEGHGNRIPAPADDDTEGHKSHVR